jgi:hypothetical protein
LDDKYSFLIYILGISIPEHINKLSVNPIKKLFIQKQEKIEYFYMSTPKKKKKQI